ncbi:MAG: hypothetical protein AAF394_01730, partial [Planctomycetota bacterium]
GQMMMYPDKCPPGADPDYPLINKGNWRDLGTPDFTTGVPKAIDDILRVTEELTGMAPLLQISAPYSLAADIYGQEPLLADVVHDPDNVNALLNHLGDHVLGRKSSWQAKLGASRPRGRQLAHRRVWSTAVVAMGAELGGRLH